jgi:hypothetical protein
MPEGISEYTAGTSTVPHHSGGAHSSTGTDQTHTRLNRRDNRRTRTIANDSVIILSSAACDFGRIAEARCAGKKNFCFTIIYFCNSDISRHTTPPDRGLRTRCAPARPARKHQTPQRIRGRPTVLRGFSE